MLSYSLFLFSRLLSIFQTYTPLINVLQQIFFLDFNTNIKTLTTQNAVYAPVREEKTSFPLTESFGHRPGLTLQNAGSVG